MNRTLTALRAGIAAGHHLGFQAFVSLDGEVVLDVAEGESKPGVRLSRHHLMLWMSAGKPIAAIAILQLVERNLIRLDTKIGDVLPGFARNGKAAITLEQILTHTAGFRGPLNNFAAGSWEQIIERVFALKQEPSWTPGEKAGYHIGSSWFVLGELVRVLSGMPFDRFVITNIFSPLGVTAFVGMSDDEFERHADQIIPMWQTEKQPPSDDWPGNSRQATTTARPGANGRGPISSLGRVYESLLFDERILSRSMADALSHARRVGMFDETFKQKLDWGLGVMIDSKKYAGEHAYGYGRHASARTFGHSGNQSSCAFADPEHRLVVAWATNGMPGEIAHQQRQRAINAAIYEDLELVVD